MWSLIVVDKFPLCLLPFVLVGLPGVMKELRDIGVMNYSSVYYPCLNWYSGVLKELCDAGEPWTMVSFIHYLLSELDIQECWGNSAMLENHELWSLYPLPFVRVGLPGVLRELWSWRAMNHGLFYPLPFVRVGLPGVLKELWCWRAMNYVLFYPQLPVRVGLPGVLKELWCWRAMNHGLFHPPLSELDFQEFWRNSTMLESAMKEGDSISSFLFRWIVIDPLVEMVLIWKSFLVNFGDWETILLIMESLIADDAD